MRGSLQKREAFPKVVGAKPVLARSLTEIDLMNPRIGGRPPHDSNLHLGDISGGSVMISDFQLDDQSLLIAELNHRLFNTLQVTSSFASRGGRADSLEAGQRFLKELNFRVASLAALHRLLIDTPDGYGLANHCRKVCAALVIVFDREDVTTPVSFQNLPLLADQSLLITLAVVELITNALKHSVAREKGATVWIDLRTVPSGAELCVTDSRREEPVAFSPSRMVVALAGALGAKPSSSFAAGTRQGSSFLLVCEPRRKKHLRLCISS